MNYKFGDLVNKQFEDDKFDKQFEDIQKQQKSAFLFVKIGVVVAGSVAIAGGCFMCWLLYTLVTGMVQ